VYSGSTIDSSATTSTDGKTGYYIVFDSNDSLQKVSDFYDKELKAKGFEISTYNTSANGIETAGFTGTKDNLTLLLTISAEGGKTKISLIAGPKN
jgi:hypothetical protein